MNILDLVSLQGAFLLRYPGDKLLWMKRKKGKQSNQKKTKAVSCATARKNIFGNFNLTFLTMFDIHTHTHTFTHTPKL